MVFRAMTTAVVIAITTADALGQTRARATRRNASIAGRIIHADGTAAEAARVSVYAVREGAPASVVGTAVSGHDGRYEVTGLPAGEFAVGVTPQRIRGFGGDSRRLTSPVETMYPGTTNRTRAQPVSVFDGVATEGIDIWLEPSAQRYSISGRVQWAEGLAVENLVLEYGGRGNVQHGVWYVPDPGGLFTIEGASRGTYVLFARGDTARGPLMGIAATDVSNDSVHDVRLTLGPPGSLEGRIVIEGTSKEELQGVTVTLTQALLKTSPLYPTPEATADGSNRFTLTQLLGEYTLAVRGLPPGWRVRRVTRAGTALSENRIPVMPAEHVTGIEVIVGNGP